MVLVPLLGGGVYGVYWLLSGQVEQTEAARRTAEDSARAEAARLREALEEARRAAAPASQGDSLRAQLEVAQARTAPLQAPLEPAQSAPGPQPPGSTPACGAYGAPTSRASRSRT